MMAGTRFLMRCPVAPFGYGSLKKVPGGTAKSLEAGRRKGWKPGPSYRRNLIHTALAAVRPPSGRDRNKDNDLPVPGRATPRQGLPGHTHLLPSI